jgi:hypothetical protein
MSRKTLRNPGKEPDKLGNLKIRRSLRQTSGIWLRGRISPARDLATEEEVRPIHVRVGDRTCPENLSGIRSTNRICLTFLGILVGR